jgi:pimeloyl-ACP methyl ester carboxylesterase
MVGHSFAGFNIRVYNRLYPADVAGVVFVDASYEYESAYIPTHTNLSLPSAIFHFNAWMAQLVYRTGLARLFTDPLDMQALPKGFSPQDWIAAHAFSERRLAETAKESMAQCAEEAMAAGSFGDRPLIVLTAALPSRVGTSPVEERRLLAEQSIWVDIQSNLARLSTKGRQVVVHDARHTIHYDRPDVVIRAVREVVEEVRVSR